MTTEQRAAVKAFLLETSLRILSRRKQRSLEDLRQAMPFHLLFFGDEGIIAAADQRSIVTSMGQTLYPGLAKVIAGLSYKNVVIGRTRKSTAITGELEEGKCGAIDNIISDLYAKKRKPNHAEEMREILSAESVRAREVEVLPDVYIGDFRPGPLFLELKSPIANLDVCAESKKKILTYLAVMHSQGNTSAEAYLGLTYNPYVKREEFKHWPVLQMMDMEAQVLVGSELWDKIGGPGTFGAVIEIISEVRREIAKHVKEALERAT